jgi:hypothetical protein
MGPAAARAAVVGPDRRFPRAQAGALRGGARLPALTGHDGSARQERHQPRASLIQSSSSSRPGTAQLLHINGSGIVVVKWLHR